MITYTNPSNHRLASSLAFFGKTKDVTEVTEAALSYAPNKVKIRICGCFAVALSGDHMKAPAVKAVY